MGWKNIKEHYRIEHYVHVTDQGICIGSGYVHNIIVIGSDGKITKRYSGTNEDLTRYLREMDADPKKLRELLDAPDSFTADLPVFTFKGGKILEKRCEAYGWPNVSHDGALMYENAFFRDPADARKAAIDNAEAGVQATAETLLEIEERLRELKDRHAKYSADLAALKAS
jgi:hypothetical protein